MDNPDHILVVDDDREICELLDEFLTRSGYRVTTVANGKAMWRALEERNFDLIVLDLMLPGESGLTLCTKLRARTDTPLVMLTARGKRPTGSSASKWAPTTTCRSRSIRASWSRGSA
jgi:two-component system OmpR family response regulator